MKPDSATDSGRTPGKRVASGIVEVVVLSMVFAAGVISHDPIIRYVRAPAGQLSSATPRADAVQVVRLRGATGGPGATADSVVPVIEAICASSAKHLVLDIDSPGGSPSQAYRIRESLRHCSDNRSAPMDIHAVIGGEGASAAYMIAAAADSITAGPYSEVGSIGAISRHIDLSAAARKMGITESVVRSGPRKALQSPWISPTPAEREDRQAFVDSVATRFAAQVIADRGGRLKTDSKTLSSGRTWTADEALEVGLIDRIGTLEGSRVALWDGAPLEIHVPGTAPALGDSADPLASAVIGSLFDVRKNTQ